jgi:hypothetical protein
MKYFKSLLYLKKKDLIQFCKSLKLSKKKYHLYTKYKIIQIINNSLINKLTLRDLQNICLNNNIIIYKTLKKKQLQQKIKYYITKNYKYNLINNYYYNKYLNNSDNTIKNIVNKKHTNINNETFGISCEYTLCKIYNLKNNLYKRINYQYINNLYPILQQFKYEFKNKFNLKCSEFIGHTNNDIDFKCSYINKKNNNITLSVKSNINNNNLCCPQNIGQCTLNSYIKKIKTFHYFKYKKINIKNKYNIKKFIIVNITKLFNIYYDNLFKCNYLLWIKKNNNNINYDIIKKPNNIKLNYKLFSFTKNLNNWNESNTLKYNNLTIGIFQIHNKRNCIKFRFNLKNLLKLIKK